MSIKELKKLREDVDEAKMYLHNSVSKLMQIIDDLDDKIEQSEKEE